MKRIKRVDPVKTATVIAIFYALLTAVIFIPMGLLFGAIGSSMPDEFSAGMMPMFSGVMMFFAPILYGFFGFIFGLIGCAVYNLIAKWTGGIALEIIDENEVVNKPTLD